MPFALHFLMHKDDLGTVRDHLRVHCLFSNIVMWEPLLSTRDMPVRRGRGMLASNVVAGGETCRSSFARGERPSAMAKAWAGDPRQGHRESRLRTCKLISSVIDQSGVRARADNERVR